MLPLVTIITPNTVEARTLTGCNDLQLAAKKLQNYGTKNVLITGTHDKTTEVINRFYQKDSPTICYKWERLSGTYHGSGCTLSSRIAANLANGNKMEKAVEDAQNYTWQTLINGMKLGKGQTLPNRFFKNNK